MDLNDIRSLVTLVSFTLFIGLMAWTWWPARRARHDTAALLPFAGDSVALLPFTGDIGVDRRGERNE